MTHHCYEAKAERGMRADASCRPFCERDAPEDANLLGDMFLYSLELQEGSDSN